MSGDALEGLLTVGHSDNKNYKILRVSSKERVSGEPYNFLCNFGNDTRLDRVTEIHFMNASIPNVANNISSAIGNNVFTYTGTISGLNTVVFEDGFYSTSQVIARLESEINISIAPSTVSVQQSSTTGKLTFTVTGAETIAYDNTGLNLTVGITEPIPATAIALAQGLPALNGGTVIYIHSVDIANNITYLSSDTGNVVDVNGAFTVPVDVPYGVYQTYQGEPETDRQVYGRNGKSLKQMRILIRGNGGRLLTEITDNFEVVLVFKVFWNPGD
jgi:hypothetical protein